VDPERKYTYSRNVLQAVETRAEAIIKAERDYSNTLRQIMEQAFALSPTQPTEEKP
jgi:hypothetical protein